ncbi:hypothetical protein F889_01043 [Acinetobacter colistiniresistens]|uniref:TonB-dependent siderophore receptor n=1 Tax=Acinetobacter colistiniresistens TaxID=280145 RepID=N9PP89_9GAMM|nr:TonB-dependent receptor [Acinetobacter colistiniresistens]ENX35374.1 hypothetical protein F889_01043 [Acinetobacter colistiniresistens]
MGRQIKPLVLMMACASMGTTAVFADEAQQSAQADTAVTLNTIRITASADASADGLTEPFAGGQVASGGRIGIFGNQKNLDTAFNLTSYTNEYIQSRQAKSVGDVLQADPSVRVARGFGNFQESYYIRGFILGSDDTAYNGLYSILPRQYIPTELFERVELLKGASAFLNGATPSSGGIGGAINLLPKRATNEPLNRVTIGTDFNGGHIANDISRRFGENQEFGVRINTAYHGGNTSVDDEKAGLGLTSIGLDYRGDRLRLSGDMGYSNNRLDATRPNITLSGVTSVPKPIDSSSNYAQKWTYSNEEDVFGSYRAEYDLTDAVTAYAAYGFRHGKENNSLANFTLTNALTGDGSSYRFDNARVDMVNTGEVGIRAKLNTGAVEHNLVLSGSAFQQNSRNAYAMDFGNSVAGNLYQPTQYEKPPISATAFIGGDLNAPKLTTRTRLRSLAIGDTLKAFDERLTVMLGARYQQLKQEGYDYNTQALQSAYNDHKVTPALGINYKLTPELAVFANYVEALAQGSSATTNGSKVITNSGEALSPYISKQKEIGLKYENQMLGASLSYFNTNRQRGILVKNANDTYTFTNQGENQHQGIELQTYGQLTEAVKLLGGVTWLDAEQKNTENGLYDKNDVIGVPKFQANLGADWQLPIEQDVSINGRVIYTGSSYADNANTLKVGDWTRLDLGANYKTQFNQVPTTFNFTINNVFDKNYWASVGGYDDAGYLNAGQPRTFMLSASFDF